MIFREKDKENYSVIGALSVSVLVVILVSLLFVIPKVGVAVLVAILLAWLVIYTMEKGEEEYYENE